MAYQSKLQKVHLFIQVKVLPALRQADLDYNKVVNLIAVETFNRPNIVIEILGTYISAGKIILIQDKEGKVLTIPDSEIKDWLETATAKKDHQVSEEKKIKDLFDSLEKKKE